ncbi:LOW QUALITY PROTEIN: pentatricopeptide repeat-containing protein At1g08070, chloroplastic-like [Dioscorea cayenensis subsp. rotundata]|uniref:LOW QUALITY PROTEIN: pentatricopeptide repeat-containing protein At1g08070, chloroplastic-like n=1 Tax=Dioscorea cayennensis subsp. rotundata TaxID=55577 RepID=A0AB40CEQ5_DIOCR|nr:LOW QUALITY PROTEIN: pentatricopeptide repeat-containing protein At1g08070, chloroplastic-like [Dioscorea cayenensis subsp. rotundata]
MVFVCMKMMPRCKLFPKWIHFHATKKPSYQILQMNQTLSQIITTNTSMTSSSLQDLIDVSISMFGPSHLLLLLTQFQHFIGTTLCNTVIKSYTHSGKHLHSILVYTQMPKIGVLPDLFTFPPLIKSVAQLNLKHLGLSIHGCTVKFGACHDVFTNTAIVHMYAILACISDACQVFDGMPERNSVTWNAMITGFVHSRRFKEAHELFNEMKRSGVEMGEVTMVNALSACAHLGALSQGVWIHNYIKHQGLRVNVFVGTTLIDMYMKCGVVDKAVEVFRTMSLKNVYTWNALISGFAMNGKGEAALEAFDMMIRGEITKPDDVTLLGVLCACCHQGLVDIGRMLFIDMERKFGVQRRIEHYGCMVDLLGRAGFLEEAHELIKTLPMKADAVIWRTLLAACRLHGDTQLGKLVIENLLQLEPENAENYVLLANMLVREQRWNEVGKVRAMLNQRRIKKVPGCSSIEIDNVVYEFVAASRFEKETMDEIYKMLEEVGMKLKVAGYVADTELVSYDLVEEEKEETLMHHSEKLALAFGMLRTQQNCTIRIVKNLRVCKDCHSFSKLVSKVYKREIVVRDRNRFHHFGGGVCSCRDYW